VRIATPSRWSAAGFAAAGVPRAQLLVLPHGVDAGVFRPGRAGDATRAETRARLGWAPPAGAGAPDGFTVLSVGHMRWTKGLDALLSGVLQAAAALRDLNAAASARAGAGFGAAARAPRCLRLVLKGLDALYGSSGAFSRTLKALRVGAAQTPGARLFAELSGAGALQMRVLGKALPPAELARLHRASDLYASPYRGEGFNMPVLEAAACGSPLLVTAGGATDDFTRPSFALYVRAERRVGETGADQGECARAPRAPPRRPPRPSYPSRHLPHPRCSRRP
jgi:glycosyltransferase involved in cell wall biosynthesis